MTARQRAGFNGAAPRGARKVVEQESDRLARQVASMGPRPAGHGKIPNADGTMSSVIASMGPRPAGHGKEEWEELVQAYSRELQWGRAPRGTESLLV